MRVANSVEHERPHERSNDPVPRFGEFAHFERHDTSMVCRIHQPARVLSTSRRRGGTRDNINSVVNYQMCEPGKCPTCRICIEKLDDHIDEHAAVLGCDPDRSVTMLTSAEMDHTGWALESHEGVRVLSVVTAGVETNATRAGDRATHFEALGGWQELEEMPKPGTINLILLINHSLTRGAMVKAGITATEAKSATLQALGVRSMYGNGIATGTGTDQYVLACPEESPFTFTEAQAHVVLGQMIASTFSRALRTALSRQCMLTPETRRSVRAVLMRFGGDVDVGSRDGDLGAVSAAMALAAIFDELDWGTLPASEAPFLVAKHAAPLVQALSADRVPIGAAEEKLAVHLKKRPGMPFQEIIDLALNLARR